MSEKLNDCPNVHCRIGKITFKAKNIKVFPSPPQRTEIHSAFIEDAARVAETLGELKGYYIIGWEDDCVPHGGFVVGDTMSKRLLPEYVYQAALEGILFG